VFGRQWRAARESEISTACPIKKEEKLILMSIGYMACCSIGFSLNVLLYYIYVILKIRKNKLRFVPMQYNDISARIFLYHYLV